MGLNLIYYIYLTLQEVVQCLGTERTRNPSIIGQFYMINYYLLHILTAILSFFSFFEGGVLLSLTCLVNFMATKISNLFLFGVWKVVGESEESFMFSFLWWDRDFSVALSDGGTIEFVWTLYLLSSEIMNLHLMGQKSHCLLTFPFLNLNGFCLDLHLL